MRSFGPRTTIVRAGDTLHQSTLLIEGILSRYIDDRNGLRQLVAVHVPGDFVDLHGYPLRTLDHDIGTMTAAKVAVVPHRNLDAILRDDPGLTRKLWFSTLLDAAVHRAWLFRMGRLDAAGRVAHFLCEMNARLASAGLSDGKRFSLGITQVDLAEICGLTSVHVNRVMRQLREDRLCIFRSSLVEILDMRRLIERGQFDPDYLYMEYPPESATSQPR
ncbi:Crp/Fnr family transcriptional regulator [Sphingobium amiense]|uniref:Crp/Fnr family transcriptional regulator n=1 Tax=Sphingobium amiense TaxID=135719 RepID=A0A494VXN3_9SPHN|nr:Crp/Fnr family transcriptional regulator [Sphingobium amiense]